MTSTIRAGLIGAGIGSATMFLLDPDRGARRRALVRDKSVWAARKTRDAAEATSRDVGNRLGGVRARVRARISDEAVDDAKLVQRVRAALGRVTSHPRAIAVAASGGWIKLTGDALASEVSAIVSAANDVRGVKGVQNDMRSHATPGGIPALQGSSTRSDSWTRWARGRWSPTAIVAAGVATGAAAIAVASLARHGVDAGETLAPDALCEEELVAVIDVR